MDKVLYYPYINLPDDKWTIRTILYWDKVGSIIPQTYGQDDKFTPFTDSLLKNGLVERISPDTVWSVSNYENSLRDAILNDTILIDKAKRNFLTGNFHKIHREKFHYHLFDELVKLEVAQKVNYTDWFIVEENVGKLMMTFLATVLSIEGDFQPTTDQISNLDVTFLNRNSDKYLSDFRKDSDVLSVNVRGDILERIMPYPIDIDLYKLRKFKDRHNDELKSFRRYIEKIVFSSSLIADQNKRTMAIEREIKDINEQKDELLKKMQEFRFQKIFFGGACGLVATATPLLLDPSFVGVPALLYGLYAIYNDTKREKIENPIHYLALTDKRFMVKQKNRS